jgi:glucose/arabinose dehydrogenase
MGVRGVLAFALLLTPIAVEATLVDSVNFTESNFVFVSGGNVTGMQWAPDGSNRLFVIQKGGQVRIVKDGALLSTPFATETVYTGSECGLIGLAFDPGFVTNAYVYLFATVSASEQQIIRYTASGDVGTNRTIILPGLPTVGANHDGGAIGFGPDGMLYWSIGDLGNGTGVDTNLTSLAAKVGRATPAGAIPPDNPFVDGAGPNNDYIWARGFRNPYTFTWRPQTEQLWINTVGTSYEQVFVVGRGDHAGWNDYENNQPAGFIRPVISYRTNGSQSRTIAATGASRSGGVATFTTTASDHGFPVGTKVLIRNVADDSFNGDFFVTEVPALNTFRVAQSGPDAVSGNGTAASLNIGGAILGGTFFESTAVPGAYRGDFFFPDFNSGNVVRADILPSGQIGSVDIWSRNITSGIDMDIGPDGNLYYVGYAGQVYRTVFNASTQGLVVSRRFLRITEGSAAAFNVRLSMQPATDVVVTVSRSGGDAALSVTTGATLTFTPDNWSTPQLVQVTSAHDAGTTDHAATFTVAADGLASEDVVIRATASDTLPAPPSAPAMLVAQATGPNSVSLNWTQSARATHYDIERASAGTAFQTLTSVTDLTYRDDSVSASNAYLYRVKATRRTWPISPRPSSSSTTR